MKQKIFNLIILFLALYFFILDLSIINQIELLVVLKLNDNKNSK
jgi:hypothetical protein